MLDKEATTEEWLRGHTPIGNGASLPDGTEVGRWRIVAFVARGGSGEVYRAVETEGSRTAALKILHRTDDAAVARFAREVQVLSELRDRAFPVFFESGTFGGRPWYATEFLQPLDMPATDRAVARFIVAVCRGAGALHARGFVHRDIKPANILFRKDEPVLIDLGLLKKAETPALHTGGTVSVVDGRPVGVGTPGYAAPEQFMGGEISPAADIHAIGVLASVCFGGRPPRAWRSIIRRATSSLPDERYPDVAALARAVRGRHLPTAFAAIAAAVAIAAAAWGAVATMASASRATDVAVAARTLYVDATRPDDSGDGQTGASAKKTIQAAINMAVDGDTIIVSDGLYEPIDSGNKAITIQSESGAARTIIDGKGTRTCAKLGDNGSLDVHKTRLIGFTLRNGRSTAGMAAAAFGGTVSRCIVTECQGEGYDGASGIKNAVVDNCLLHRNRYVPNRTTLHLGGRLFPYFGGGVLANCKVTNCTVADNEGYGIWDGEICNCIVVNNTFDAYFSHEVIRVVDAADNTSTADLSPTVLPPVANFCRFTKRHSIQVGKAIGLPIGGRGNTYGPASFVDGARGDYRLSADSPCIDAGDSASAENESDLVGDARVVGESVDLGCYESHRP